MTPFCYQIPPIDLNWHFLMDEHEFERRKAKAAHESYGNFTIHKHLALLEAARIGWEGDYQDLYVFVVPDEVQFMYGFVFKQSNNGTTFVCSPVPMPHLKALAFNGSEHGQLFGEDDPVKLSMIL